MNSRVIVAAALLLQACAAPPPGPAPVAGESPDGAALGQIHREARVPALEGPRFSHEELWHELGPLVDSAAHLERIRLGTSAEGREIYRIRFGDGPIRVLMWSQMHGDESTATRALLDLFNLISRSPGHPVVRRLGDRLTIEAVPMLNPDGAERFQRHNVFGIDVNRDARALETPEGQALRAAHRELRPDFGFNLHDQSVRTRVGREDRIAAFSLLAPPPDASRSVTPERLRAMRLAAVVRDAVEPLVPGHVARYSDAFNPRAFGDLMQSWGTSTVLFEAGGWRNDDDKEYLRKVNFAAILAALDAIATGAYQHADTTRYRGLPLNGPQARDVVLLGGRIVLPDTEPVRADIAVNYGDPIHWTDGRVVEMGDLAEAFARDTLRVDGAYVHVHPDALDSGGGLAPGAPAHFIIRETEAAASPRIAEILPHRRPGPELRR